MSKSFLVLFSKKNTFLFSSLFWCPTAFRLVSTDCLWHPTPMPDPVAFWVPLLIEHARITAGQRVLDVGRGTGGFARAIAEAFRVLAAGGRVVVRTIAPEDVASRVPHRFFPTVAATDAERMPRLDTIETWLRDSGFNAIGCCTPPK
jgi:hypothetical protein